VPGSLNTQMIYLNDLLAASGGKRVGPPTPRRFPAFCYDARRIQPGDLFVAVKTEDGDGHDHIALAEENDGTHFLTSAKTGDHVNETFTYLAEAIVKKIKH